MHIYLKREGAASQARCSAAVTAALAQPLQRLGRRGPPLRQQALLYERQHARWAVAQRDRQTEIAAPVDHSLSGNLHQQHAKGIPAQEGAVRWLRSGTPSWRSVLGMPGSKQGVVACTQHTHMSAASVHRLPSSCSGAAYRWLPPTAVAALAPPSTWETPMSDRWPRRSSDSSTLLWGQGGGPNRQNGELR